MNNLELILLKRCPDKFNGIRCAAEKKLASNTYDFEGATRATTKRQRNDLRLIIYGFSLTLFLCLAFICKTNN
jgi:hypothetical protein